MGVKAYGELGRQEGNGPKGLRTPACGRGGGGGARKQNRPGDMKS